VCVVLQVFEGEAASKKLAMHVAAERALRVLGHCDNGKDGDVQMADDSPVKKSSKVLPSVASGKNPVMIINETHPDAEYSLVSENGDGMAKTFTMSVSVDNQTFSGSGRSKRLAKASAAQAALSELHGVISFASPGE